MSPPYNESDASVHRQTLLPERSFDQPATQQKKRTEPDQDDQQAIQARWSSLFAFTTRAHMLPFSIALGLSVVSGVIMPALALFLGMIFDSFTAFGSGAVDGGTLADRVSMNAIYLVALGGASWLLNGTYFMLWLVFGELQAKSARDKLYAGMLEKEMAWYDNRKAGINALVPRTQT